MGSNISVWPLAPAKEAVIKLRERPAEWVDRRIVTPRGKRRLTAF
jgi:hypothetical protein